MKTPYTRQGKQIFVHDVLACTMVNEETAKRCLKAMNKNFEVIVNDTAIGECSKSIAIKHGCSEFHGIWANK